MSDAMLVAQGLSLSRGVRQLFVGLNLSVMPGSATILRGPNGVGKTSLLRVLAGLTVPDEGNIAIGGEVTTALSLMARQTVLYIGHANALKDELTTDENLSTQLALDGQSVRPEVRLDALRSVGLWDRRNVQGRRLSQGQKRRIGLARLWVNIGRQGKRVWLLDEPTNALDQAGASLFMDIIDAQLASGGAAVIATHLPLELSGASVDFNMAVPE
ncbi:MAG: heme ABC exporter ATP-binding protein CcmA [Betaproteobacteria bacterium]|jgi:heme exporter protein A